MADDYGYAIGVPVLLIVVVVLLYLLHKKYSCCDRICGPENSAKEDSGEQVEYPDHKFLDIETEEQHKSELENLSRTLRDLRPPASTTTSAPSTSQVTDNNGYLVIPGIPSSEICPQKPSVYTVERDSIIVNRPRPVRVPGVIESYPVIQIRSRTPTPGNPITIAVDATPYRIAGYCVNSNESEIFYYTLKSSLLPQLFSRDDLPKEFEMKNLLCALVTFEDLINRYQKVQIYTDNWAINDRFDYYGTAVHCFLKHLSNCYNVEVVNFKSMHIHRHKKPQLFDKWILPADHLSRNKVADFLDEMDRYNFYTISSISVNEVRRSLRFAFSEDCPNECAWYSEFQVVNY